MQKACYRMICRLFVGFDTLLAESGGSEQTDFKCTLGYIFSISCLQGTCLGHHQNNTKRISLLILIYGSCIANANIYCKYS